MKYQTGSIGRAFLARVDHGEDLLVELTRLARSEDIRQAFFMLIGAIRDARIVTGPKEDTVPPDPIWSTITDAHEILGTGNILQKDGEPSIHIHAALGREGETLTGCLRDSVGAYLTIEVFILEITGDLAERAYDDTLGITRMAL